LGEKKRHLGIKESTWEAGRFEQKGVVCQKGFRERRVKIRGKNLLKLNTRVFLNGGFVVLGLWGRRSNKSGCPDQGWGTTYTKPPYGKLERVKRGYLQPNDLEKRGKQTYS